MASAAAQKFFDSQSPKDRMAIIDSWNGADLMDEWYNNAKAAGSVPTSGTATSAAPTTPTVEDIRKQAAGNSEDFSRFSNEEVASFGANYDAAASQAAGRPQYRSQRGAPGFFDKPDECPAGQSPSGPNADSPCKSNEQLLAAQGAGQPVPGQGTPGQGQNAAYYGQDDPLQRYLTGLLESGGGSFTGAAKGGQLAGGGVWSQPGGFAELPAPAPLAGALGMAAPTPSAGPVPQLQGMGMATPGGYNPGSSALQALGAKEQGGFTGASMGPAQVVSPFSMPQGSTLEDMINPDRRRPHDARIGGSWF